MAGSQDGGDPRSDDHRGRARELSVLADSLPKLELTMRAKCRYARRGIAGVGETSVKLASLAAR